MAKVIVQKRNLIGIPREVREALRISEGDVLEMKVEANRVILEPYRLVPADQAWFWNESVQSAVKEAKEDVKKGRVRVVSSSEEVFAGLKGE